MIRTDYMQQCMNETSESVGSKAVLLAFSNPSITLLETWEILIAERIEKDYFYDHSECCELVEFVYKENPYLPTTHVYKKVARLIIESKIESKPHNQIQ